MMRWSTTSSWHIDAAAGAVHPITPILPAARELGCAIVAYRVLGDGLLSGAAAERPVGVESRLVPPRMQGENLQRNIATAAFLKGMAAKKAHTPAQVAVAWLLSRGDDIFPLVGMSRRSRLSENLGILDVRLDASDLVALDQAFAPGAIVGDRYPAFVLKYAAR